MSDGYRGGGLDGYRGVPYGNPNGGSQAPFEGQRGTTFYTMHALSDNGVDPSIRNDTNDEHQKLTLRQRIWRFKDWLKGDY
jgi:hypothetical protein